MEFLQDLFALIGRVLIGGVFLWGTFEKMRHWRSVVSYYKTKNIPLLKTILPIGIIMKIVGSLSLLFGWYTHVGALLLLIVALLALFKIHDFWAFNKREQAGQKLLFMKELSIIGGLFMILAFGSGNFSISQLLS